MKADEAMPIRNSLNIVRSDSTLESSIRVSDCKFSTVIFDCVEETSDFESINLIVLQRCSRCFSNGGCDASNQWGLLKKNSMVLEGVTLSMRNGIMVIPLLTALSTSRIT